MTRLPPSFALWYHINTCMKTILELESISHRYGERQILQNLSLQVAAGEVVSVIGSSGAGKTTLFRIISGMSELQTGKLRRMSEVTYMMQDDLLLPWRTVLQNMLLLQELGSGSATQESAHALLREVGLEEHIHHYPHQLSGGQRQRVALARALLQGRPLLLLDEPFGALDLVTRERMYALLQAVRSRHEITLLLITHDFRDALHLSDRVLLLNEGRITNEWKRHDVDEQTLRSALLSCG